MSSRAPILSGGRLCPCCGRPVRGGRILVNLDTNTVTHGRRRVTLPPAEAEMLSVIADAYPGTVPLARIRTALWGGYDMPLSSEKAIHVYASKIRSAIRSIGLRLENVSSRGYRISKVNQHDQA